ncbi:MAG: PAS domain S-box protein, partial [Candidatus Electryoneaceae bacterium]|nr:PAS domain S-box protein [Candidatus Electryoneaceae bacterium]
MDATVILKHSLLDSSNLGIRKIGEIMIEKKYYVSRFVLNGNPYIISSHFMPSTGWRLGVVVPESVILASVQEVRNTLDLTVDKMVGKFTLVTVLFLIFSIIVIVVFSVKSFIRPLDKLSAGALRVKEGDLTKHVNIHTKDEMGSVAQLFNSMVDTLREAKELEKEYTQTLEQKMKDRTREIMIKSEDLKKISERLELAMDAGEHGLWDWNLDTDDIYFSPRYYTMLGYEPGELPMELKTWVNLMHPDDQKTIVPEVENYVKNAQPYELEFRLKTKDGDWKWISGRGKSYEKDADSIPHRAVGIHVDISERKRAEEALRQSEENFKAVLGASPVGIGLVINRKLDWANKTMYSMVGYEQVSLLGQSARVLYPDDEEFERMGKQLYAGIKESGTVQAETRWVRKDGTVFDCIIRLTYLDPSDPAKGQIIAVTDVSELKSAHEKLRESDLRHRLLVENANDAIFIAQDEAIKFPNPKTEELTGCSAEELANMSFLEFIHPEDRDMVLDKHKRRLKGEDFPSTYSFRIINRDGEKLWTQLNSILITWEGRPATLNFLRDITEQKKLEFQLQRAQKMEAIGTLAGGVAHDLNNVLSGIVSYPELLLLDLPEDSPLRKPILTIQKSGQKAADIVQDLLTLARRGVVATEVVNINQIINSNLKSPECENLKQFYPDAKIESNLEAYLLNIMGSSVHLSKTVMNLVSNAAEAMPEGGNIFISTESKYIDKPIRGYDDVKEGDYVILTVSDTGIGISSGDLERIFEPFYTKKVMGRSGTGLGMAVVWGTVKDHKGYIDVQSTEGKG